MSALNLRKVCAGAFAMACLAATAFAAEPVVKTVPWIAADASVPHPTYASAQVTLKGTSSLQGSNIQATWDFGDGSSPKTFTVTNGFDVSAVHVYDGAVGTTYTARLTVTDITTGESSSATYPVAVQEKNLETEVNRAIDEGLWYLHRTMSRVSLGDVAVGHWQGACAACDGRGTANAWNLLAFERYGHLESGDPSNPYTETVSRGLKTLFSELNEDGVPSGAWLDAVATAASPNARATTGPSNVIGRTYREILQRLLAAAGEQATGSGVAAARKSLGLNARQASVSGGRATQTLLQLALSGADRSAQEWAEAEAAILSRNSLELDAQSLFELAEAMRLHAPAQNSGAALDWYAAEVNLGATLNGAARVLVNRQSDSGFWTGHAGGSQQASLETAQSLMALQKTPIRSAGISSVFNVTSRASVVHSGNVYNRLTGTFNGFLVVKNISSEIITGPVTVGLMNLPAGVTLVNANGTFNGAPYVIVTAGSLAPGQSASAPVRFTNSSTSLIGFTRVVYSGVFPPAALSLACPAPAATLNAPYSSALSADGGVQLYTYAISVGTLPSGLTLDTATGAITGTPDTVGTSNFTATVTDSAGGTPQTMNAACSINVPSANNSPTANPQTLSTNEDTPLVVTLTGSDPDGNSLTFSIVGSPSNGTVGAITPINATSASVTFTPSANFNGAAGFSFQVSDGLGGTNTAAVGITVNPVNDAPSFVKGADQTVLEDSGAQSVPGWATAISAGPADEAVQGLTFNITGNSNPALFSAGPAVAADGTLTYTPAANASGSATITLTLSDLGGTANGGVNTSGPQEFIINVTPVNDAPSFTKGADQTVLEDAAPQTIPNWATAISAGANESGQTVSFVIVSNDNPSLFSAGPAVSPTGTLTYTLAANRNGVANLSVRIQDDGGTANGGVNESPAQSFTITVTAVNDKPFMTGAPKSFSAQANMRINGLGGLLAGASDANDPENGSPAFTVGAIGGAAASSVLNINAATGTFDFNPPAGATGAHTFNYVICDNGVPLPAACSDPINVTVNIAGPVIWFVNGAAAAGGNGTLSAPFQTLAQANAVDAANHRIFLHSGTYANGIPLNSGEWLIGQGVTGFASFDNLMGITPPAGTVARPAVATGSVTVQGNVVLAPTTVLKALAINVTGSTEGLSGSSATGVDVVQTSVSSATGRAVNFNTVTGAISLISVSSNGAPSGISLASHTGSFAVLGTGSANTGGLIQNSTGDGVVMNGAENVSFKDLRVISSSDNNLDARSVNGLVLDRSTFDTTPGGAPADLTSRHNFYGNTITNLTIQNGTVLDGGTTNQVNIHNVKIDNLLGASVIDNSTIRDGKDMNVLIQNFTATNFAGTPDSITIRNNTRIQNPSPGTIPGDNVQIRAENNANMSVTITGGAAGNSQFTGASQNVVQLLAEGPGAGPSGKMIASISNAIMTGANGPAINLNAGQTGSLTATVSGLTLASALSSPINIVNFDTSTIKATITGNTLSSPAQGGLGGINHEAEGGGTITSLITNNNISGKMDNGIFANPKKPGSKINLTATNNTINIDAGSLHGIAVVTGLSDGSGGNAGVCLNLTNNNATAPGGSGYRFNNRAGTIFQLQGYVGGATSTSDVAAWVASKGNVGTVSATIPAGASYTAATCAVP